MCRVAWAFAVFVLSTTFLLPLPSRGTWRCTICGAGIDRTHVLGAVVATRPEASPAEYVEWARRFEGWYGREIAEPHRHDWMPVGCHTRGFSSFHCSLHLAAPYFRSLPVCEDQELARRMARAVLDAPKARRREMLLAFAKSSYLHRPLEPAELSVIFASWPR